MATRAKHAPPAPSAAAAPESGSEWEESDSEAASEADQQDPRRRQQQQSALAATPLRSNAGAASSALHPHPPTEPRQSRESASSSSASAAAAAVASGSARYAPAHPLRLPPKHEQWGWRYEHPTILSPSGRRIADQLVREAIPPPNLHNAMMAGETAGTAGAVRFDESASSAASPRKDGSTGNAAAADAATGSRSPRKSARSDVNAVSALTSKLVNTVAPPVAPYMAFSEASQYREIIHPPVSPRSLLLSKLTHPRVALPAESLAAGLPLRPDSWVHTSKSKHGLGTGGGKVGGAHADGFDASLSLYEQRLFQKLGKGLEDPKAAAAQALAQGNNHNSRAATAARKAAALRQKKQQSHEESLAAATQALELGIDPLIGTDSSAWGHLPLTTRPRTSNDARGRKEVLHMLSAFRHAPRGAAILAIKQKEREQGREREMAAAEGTSGGAGGYDAVRAQLASAPSSLQGSSSARRSSAPGTSPRDFRALVAAGSAFGGNIAGAAAPQVIPFSPWSKQATGSWGHTMAHEHLNSPGSPSRSGTASGGRSSPRKLQSPQQSPPGFFPSHFAASLGAGSGGFASSFHAHLSGGSRPSHHTSSVSAAPAPASYHRVLAPAFMNCPARIEAGQGPPPRTGGSGGGGARAHNPGADHKAQRDRTDRMRIGAAEQTNRFTAFPGPLVADRAAATKSRAAMLSAGGDGSLNSPRSGASTARGASRSYAAAAAAFRDGSQSARGVRSSSSAAAATEEKENLSLSAPLAALPLPAELDLSLTHARLKDFELRALACNRAGRRSAEANAIFCQGILWDNIREYAKAIECYRKFKDILCNAGGSGNNATSQEGGAAAAASPPTTLRTAEDAFALALAHNSMGISSQLLGTRAGYLAALAHHARHRDVADLPGQFVAHTNLGIVYQLMASREAEEPGEQAGSENGADPAADPAQQQSSAAGRARALTEQAAFAHQSALRCALQLHSLSGQSLAIGNLGLTALQHLDFQTARACMLRHLQLSRALGDYRGQSSAFHTLGSIASQEGAHQEAMLFFQSAVQVAHVLRDVGSADQARVQAAVAAGNAQLKASGAHVYLAAAGLLEPNSDPYAYADDAGQQ